MGAVEEGQILLMPHAREAGVKEGVQRSWRFPIWQVAGDGSAHDLVAGCMAVQMPVVAFGWNMHRALQLPFWMEILKFALLAGVSFILIRIVADLSCVTALVLLSLGTLAIGVTYATVRRFQIRARFGIPGSWQEDMLSWLCLPVCALAQETRTLTVNQVHEGVWYGQLVGNVDGVPPTQQMV